MAKRSRIYGLLAEFDDAHAVVEAARRVHAEGYRRVDAYTPFPIDELSEALGFQRSRVAMVTLIGGILGAAGGFFMMWYANVIAYPWNIGGRPPNSWPAWIPITFELMVLCAGLAAVLGMLALNGLPRPYHPLFNIPAFSLASRDRFFLCIQANDPHFDNERTKELLISFKPLGIFEVPP